MRTPLLLLLLPLACGRGLQSRADGGNVVVEPAGDCMRSLADDVHLAIASQPQAFGGVRAMVFDALGQLWVLDRPGKNGPAAVMLFSAAPRQLLRSFGQQQLTAAVGLALGPAGRVYVLETEPTLPRHSHVTVFDDQGTQVGSFPVADDAAAVAFDAQGELVVAADVLNRYDVSGAELGSIGLYGSTPGHLSWPIAVVNDARGPLWVSELVRNAVMEFDQSTGALLQEFGGRGTAPGLFDGQEPDPGVSWGPTSLALDANGNLYADDPGNGRLQKLSRIGAGLAQFDFAGSRKVGPVAVEPGTGFVYVGRLTGIDVVCPL